MAGKAKKRKPLTAREKKQRAEWRAEWREKGLLPPVKKPLNRKKYIKEAAAEFDAAKFTVYELQYLVHAVGFVAGQFQPDRDAVGAAKVLKVACAIKEYYAAARAADEEITLDTLYNRIKPILEA